MKVEREEKVNEQDLKALLSQTQQQNKMLVEAVNKMRNDLAVIRMELSFKVLDNHTLFPQDFVAKITSEIMETFYPKEEVLKTNGSQDN